MSDFLTRMAQLSRGEATAVTPRLPGLFAPVKETGLAPAEPNDAVQTTQQTEAITVADDLPQTVAQDSLAAEQPVNHKPVNRQDDRTVDEPKPLITQQDSHDDIPFSDAPFFTGLQNETVTQQPGIRYNARASRGLENKPQTLLSAIINKPAETAVTGNISQAPVSTHQSVPLVPGHKNTIPAPQQVIAELQATAAQTPDQEPAVHINIGRIEVRAQTTPKAPVPRPARSEPQSTLSLNDYLKRSGGSS